MGTVGVIFLSIMCLNLATKTAQADADEEWDKKLAEVAGKCKVEHNIDEKTFEAMVTKRLVPDTENGKCAMACIMNGLGYVKDGKIDLEQMKAANKLRYEKPEELELAGKLDGLCVKEGASQSDMCESAYTIATCLVKEYAKAGLNI